METVKFIDIKRAIELGDNIREKLSELYVDAFFEDGLKFFSKDKEKLKKAFCHVFELEYFYVAIIDNEIAGMIACVGRGPFCMNLSKKIFIKYLGFFKGLFTWFAFRKYKNRCKNLDADTAMVEFLATNIKYRNMGVATSLFKHLFTLPEYHYFVGEVADTNPRAFELYKRLGFKETSRKKFIPNSGINYWIQIKHTKANQ
jgi:ribosomal protein S18 acetylase RimI-like enzyme